MALKTFRPTAPSLRQLVIVDRSELYKGKPVKALTVGKSRRVDATKHWPDHRALPRRRSQTDLSHRRLQRRKLDVVARSSGWNTAPTAPASLRSLRMRMVSKPTSSPRNVCLPETR